MRECPYGNNLPKTQITVMGMERIFPTYEEFEVLVSLLTRSAVGQRLTSYVTALTGPREIGEIDGPEEFHLVIVDNGRSAILGTEFQPVYSVFVVRHVSMFVLSTAILEDTLMVRLSGTNWCCINPLLGGYEEHKELPYAIIIMWCLHRSLSSENSFT